MPKVTVVVPAHNMSDTIADSVRSALHQGFTSLEVVVVDDGSTDGTIQVLAAIDDPRLRVIRVEACRGPSAARNAGVLAARGEFIALLDADDVWLPSKVAKQVDVFEQNPSAGLVYCGAHQTDVRLQYLRTPALGDPWPSGKHEVVRRILRGPFITGLPLSTVMVRRQCFFDVGLFDEKITQGEELDFAPRLAQKDWQIRFLNEPLVLYRMTGHFNPEKRLSRRIGEAHEITIRRAFDRLGNPPELEPLKTEALLESYWVTALYQYAVHQPDLAHVELERILRRWPGYLDLRHNPQLRTSMAYVAFGLYDTVTPLREAFAFVDYVFDNLPSTVDCRRWDRKRVKAEVAAITAFDSCPRGETWCVARAVSFAWLLNPSLLSNIGLMKLPLLALTDAPPEMPGLASSREVAL